MDKEQASVESQEDYDNVLSYIKEEAQEVDIEEPYVITEKYVIKVEKEWEGLYDEIEAFFNGEEEDFFAKLDLGPTFVMNIHKMDWNTY